MIRLGLLTSTLQSTSNGKWNQLKAGLHCPSLNQFPLKSRQLSVQLHLVYVWSHCRASSMKVSEKQIHRVTGGGTSKRDPGCAWALVVSEFSNLYLISSLWISISRSFTFFQISPHLPSKHAFIFLSLHPAYLWSTNWSFWQSVSLSLSLSTSNMDHLSLHSLWSHIRCFIYPPPLLHPPLLRLIFSLPFCYHPCESLHFYLFALSIKGALVR